MADAVKPGDSGDWLRAKNIDQTATEAGRIFDALAPNALTTVFSGSAATGLGVVFLNPGAAAGTDIAIVSPTTTVSSGAATWTAVLVRDPAGGGAGGVSTVTADQGASGTQAWPVAQSGPIAVSAITLPAVSVGTIQSVVASVSALPAVSVGTIAAVSVSAIPSVLASISAIPSVLVSASALPAISVSANVSQLVSVSAIPSVVASVSAIPSIVASVSALPAVSVSAIAAISVGTIVQPIAVQPRATGNPGTVSFSFATTTATSISTTLLASSNGTKIVIKAYGVWNGDTTIHDFQVLNGASNSVAIPAYIAAGAGGHNIGYPDPFPLAANVGLAVAVTGAIGTRGIAGYFEYTTVAT